MSEEKTAINNLIPERYYTPQVQPPALSISVYEATPSPDSVVLKQTRTPKSQNHCLACLLACFLCCAVKGEVK